MGEINSRYSNVIKFNYKPFPLSISELMKPAHRITIKGLPGDHIFEIIRRTQAFYEMAALESIYRYLPHPRGLFIDVGANIGNHTVFFAKVLGASGICVEASSRAAELLRTNITLNGLSDKVYVVEAGAGDRNTTAALIETETSNIGKTHVVEQTSDFATHPTIPIRTIADIVAEVAKKDAREISLIKIDVEGFEQRVIMGAIPVIERYRPLVVVELKTDEAFQWTKQCLSEYGYRSFLKLPTATPTYMMSTELAKSSHNRDYTYRAWVSYKRGRIYRWIRRAKKLLRE